ncbi:hypothetical protein [Bacillus weihaiensis]|uniref:hypothetical protein n=1 Tax=Bacillus weihaiensis TaxID=1547283 RepID=UPI001314480B|nr:hypothetical protein [Bacillus weihaiensis]
MGVLSAIFGALSAILGVLSAISASLSAIFGVLSAIRDVPTNFAHPSSSHFHLFIPPAT